MKHLAFVLFALLTFGFSGVAQAGWRHHCCGQPAQMVYVAGAPSDGAQSAVWEGVLIKLAEKLIGGIPVNPGTGGGGLPITSDGDRVDLTKIEASLAGLSERVENVNTTLRTHGETLVGIDARLAAVESDVKKFNATAGRLDESSPIVAKLNAIELKLAGKTPEQVRAAFLTPQFLESEIKDLVGDEAKAATIAAAIKAQLEKALKP